MREKARIQRILSLLETIWQRQPDVRFNQLVSNLQYMYSAQNEGYGKRKVVEKCDSGDMETSYLDFFYLEDTEWEGFLKSIVEEKVADKGTSKNEIVDKVIQAIKLILAGKTAGEIAEVLALSPKYVEKINKDLLKGTTLEQLMKQFATYEKKLSDERSRLDGDTLNSKFSTTSLHKECTHLLIEEDDEEKLSALHVINNKLYPLHYDCEEDDYYVINENGIYCYSIDVFVRVKMLKRVN